MVIFRLVQREPQERKNPTTPAFSPRKKPFSRTFSVSARMYTRYNLSVGGGGSIEGKIKALPAVAYEVNH